MPVENNRQPGGGDWAFDPTTMATRCSAFITRVVDAARARGVVVGLSGGIDSAVAAALAVEALGRQRVLGLLLPYATSAPASLRDAQAVAQQLNIDTELLAISPMVDAFLAACPDADPIRRGNVMARARMIALYDRSARDGRLVLGTGNRTEALLGYTTIHGDNACALNPLGNLYKTEIRRLAAHLELPAAVLTKRPSADLWEGQADEDELGFTYAEADRLLHHLIDERLAPRQLESLGFDRELIERVNTLVARMRFKRVLPPMADFPGRPDPDDGGGSV